MTAPVPPTPDDHEDDDPTGSFYTGLGMVAVGAIIAYAPHTETWAEQITPDAGGRRAGLARLLASIDPIVITGVGVLLAVVGAVITVRAFRKGRRLADEERDARPTA